MKTKHAALEEARLLYLQSSAGVTDQELADYLGVSRYTANRYRNQLGARIVSHGHYTLEPTPDDVRLARAILARVSE